jgi:hypothetical protein
MSRKLNKLVKGLDPVADAFSGTVYSDIVSLRNYAYAEFIIYKAVGAAGTSTVTVEACDDVSGSNVSAVPFTYQAITSGDTPGAVTSVASTGFTTTAGSSQLYTIKVDASVLGASGYGFARLKCVEVVDGAVLGGILIQLSEPRVASEVPPTAIV